MGISLFGWLEKIPAWRDLPYPTKGALLRAIKAGLSVTISILVTAAAQGILFPADFTPMMIIVITTFLQSVDKFIREWEIAREMAKEPVPLTDNPEPEALPATGD